MIQRRWVSKRYDIDLEKIAKRYQISEILAEILVKRGLFDWEAMDRYLFPEMDKMYDSYQMKDMERGMLLLKEALAQKKKIKVIGDYDVDGVMASYILYQGICMLGGSAGYRIPHRIHDGYGMRTYMVQEAFEEGYEVIITCDNGISASDAVRRAKELGMTVIVTDHHDVPKEGEKELLPPADAVIDPKQQECSYPFKQLCGAGIAYKMVAGLLEQAGISGYEEELLPFAAIATVCDVVPLLGENRIFVKNGLRLIKQCPNQGLKKLIEVLQFTREIESGDVGFRIGPCINAAGRLADASLGMELFLEQNGEAAAKKARKLADLNEERKDYTAKATQDAILQIEGEGFLDRGEKVFVVYLEDCHESVAGIVAGRIREKYYRPVLIVTKGEHCLKGSARSIPGYHMQAALNEAKELLLEYGGHALAAGFSLKEENLPVLREYLNRHCTLTEQQLIETVYFDKEIPLANMTEPLVRQMEQMKPYGQANERALFARRGVEIVSFRLCGRENQIGQMELKDGMRIYHAVAFQCEKQVGGAIASRYGEAFWNEMKAGKPQHCVLDFLYQPNINEKYGGVDFIIVDSR